MTPTNLIDNPSNFQNTGPEIKLRTACSTGAPHATMPSQTNQTKRQDKQVSSEPGPAQQLQNFILDDSILRNVESLILNRELTNLHTVSTVFLALKSQTLAIGYQMLQNTHQGT